MENIGLPKSIKPRPYWIQYVSTYIVFFLSLFIGKIKVKGRHNIPKEGSFVLASNHFGYFDPFVLARELGHTRLAPRPVFNVRVGVTLSPSTSCHGTQSSGPTPPSTAH